MRTYDDWLVGLKERLSDPNYARIFFDAVVSDFIETRFFPAFLESTDLLINAQKNIDTELVREVYLVLGTIYFYLKDYDKAKQNFNSATECNPKDKEAKLMADLTLLYENKAENENGILTDYIGLSSAIGGIIDKPYEELRV